MDKGFLLMCLHVAQLSRTRAAEVAGVSRMTLHRQIKRHRIKAPHPYKAAGGFTRYLQNRDKNRLTDYTNHD